MFRQLIFKPCRYFKKKRQASFSLFVNLCFFEESPPPTFCSLQDLKKVPLWAFCSRNFPNNKTKEPHQHSTTHPTPTAKAVIFFSSLDRVPLPPQPHDLHYRGPDPRSILGLVNKENIRVWAVDPSVVSTGYKCEAQPTILPDMCFVNNNKRNVKEVQDEKSQVSFFYIFLREQKTQIPSFDFDNRSFFLRHHRNYLK